MPCEAFVRCSPQQGYVVWRITESEAVLRQRMATTLDLASCNAISHPIKRKEWLATRLAYQYLCQTMKLPCAPIQKDNAGRPYVEASTAKPPPYISLSHSFPFAAAMLSSNQPIGLDIEKPTSKLLRIAAKYLTPTEIVDCNADLEKHCIYWSAKEAIYKAYAHSQSLDLSSIQIHPFIKAGAGALQGYTPYGHQYTVQYFLHQEYVLTWCS